MALATVPGAEQPIYGGSPKLQAFEAVVGVPEALELDPMRSIIDRYKLHIFRFSSLDSR